MNIRKIAYHLFFWAVFFYSLWVIIFKYAPDFSPNVRILWSGPIAGTIAILFAALRSNAVMTQSSGGEELKLFSNKIYDNALSFIKRSYCAMFPVLLISFALVFAYISMQASACFVAGIISTLLAGFVGTLVAGKANAKAVNAAQSSCADASGIIFSSGLIMGFVIVGLAMICIPALFFIFKDPLIIPGYALGVGAAALYTGVGGSIFAQSAAFGENIALEANSQVLENDIKNPASITANAGGNIGGTTAMGAGMLFLYAASIVTAMVLGSQNLDLLGVFIPLTIASVGIFASIAGCVFVKTTKMLSPFASIQLGITISVILFTGLSYYLVEKIFTTGYFPPILAGVLTGVLLSIVTRFFTTSRFYPVKYIAKSAKKGNMILALSSIKTGLVAAFFPIAIISFSAILTFLLAGGMYSYYSGSYGISIAAVSMLSMAGIISAVNSYAPIVGNANNLAQISNLKNETNEINKDLNSAGNAAEAMGKAFTLGASALVSISVLIAFAISTHLGEVDILNPFVITSILFGAGMPFLFMALIHFAAGWGASGIAKEVKKQTTENPSILDGGIEPEYKKCTKISCNAGIFGITLPAAFAAIAPIAVGITVAYVSAKMSGIPYAFGKVNGTQAMSGFLCGAIISGICLNFVTANSISAYLSARTLIDNENKNIAPILAFKNANWVSVDILIKLMAILALAASNSFIVR